MCFKMHKNPIPQDILTIIEQFFPLFPLAILFIDCHELKRNYILN